LENAFKLELNNRILKTFTNTNKSWKNDKKLAKIVKKMKKGKNLKQKELSKVYWTIWKKGNY
jgi:hypothetical protein